MPRARPLNIPRRCSIAHPEWRSPRVSVLGQTRGIEGYVTWRRRSLMIVPASCRNTVDFAVRPVTIWRGSVRTTDIGGECCHGLAVKTRLHRIWASELIATSATMPKSIPAELGNPKKVKHTVKNGRVLAGNGDPQWRISQFG